jgi:hypothetical protein
VEGQNPKLYSGTLTFYGIVKAAEIPAHSGQGKMDPGVVAEVEGVPRRAVATKPEGVPSPRPKTRSLLSVLSKASFTKTCSAQSNRPPSDDDEETSAHSDVPIAQRSHSRPLERLSADSPDASQGALFPICGDPISPICQKSNSFFARLLTVCHAAHRRILLHGRSLH